MRWIIWALAATFYLYEFFLRVAPSVMVPDLMSTFSVDALAVGSLSAFYYYIYAPMQLPVGILTDKYGARRLLGYSALAAGIGTLLFAIAPSYWVAASGRFLMGASSAFGFVGMVYICAHWFPKDKQGILVGMANTIGMFGAMLGQGPLSIMIGFFGWRPTMGGLAAFGLVLAALIFLFMRNDPPALEHHEAETPPDHHHMFSNLLIVMKSGQSWINAILALFLYTSTSVFAGLWGIPFISNVYGVSTKVASFAVSMIFVGWAVGGPLIGIYSDRIQRKKPILMGAALICAFLMTLVVYVHSLPLPLLYPLFFLIGFLSSSELLSFTYAIDLNPRYAKATALTFTNLITILGAVILQPFIGFLLDLNWTGTMANGVHTYTVANYTFAMSLFPLSFFIAFLLGFFLKKVKHIPS